MYRTDGSSTADSPPLISIRSSIILMLFKRHRSCFRFTDDSLDHLSSSITDRVGAVLGDERRAKEQTDMKGTSKASGLYEVRTKNDFGSDRSGGVE
eukprot:756481-Hanusia_phi.AAC.1